MWVNVGLVCYSLIGVIVGKLKKHIIKINTFLSNIAGVYIAQFRKMRPTKCVKVVL